MQEMLTLYERAVDSGDLPMLAHESQGKEEDAGSLVRPIFSVWSGCQSGKLVASVTNPQRLRGLFHSVSLHLAG